MKKATAVHFIDRVLNKVWLAEQQFKIIGLKTFGGKLEEGQSIEECTVGEVTDETGGNKDLRINPEEEGGIVFDPKDLVPVGIIDFYNGNTEEVPDGNPSFRVLFYNCYKFSGKAIDTVEMRNPYQYDIDNIPEKKLVVGDELFLKYLLRGQKIKVKIRRTSDWKEVLEYKIDTCEECDLVL